jgi:hypothetical protein
MFVTALAQAPQVAGAGKPPAPPPRFALSGLEPCADAENRPVLNHVELI